LVHKTDIGGVLLNLQSADAVREAFESIRAIAIAQKVVDSMEGVLIQPMLKGGVEVMVGMSEEPRFGPLIAFGLGGIHVEVLGDVAFRMTPLTDRDADEMVKSIRGYRLLKGYRNLPPADIPAVEELLLRLSRLVEEVPEIRELDLNPVFVFPEDQGCIIIDARIRVGMTDTP
jgi:acyl-CoA synthetase (NDP forming)